MDEMDEIQNFRAEVPESAQGSLSPARNRLTDEARNPRGGLCARLPHPRRGLLRVATASTLTVALAGGLIATQTIDFSGSPASGGGSGGPAAAASAVEVLDRAAATVKEKGGPAGQQGEFVYRERKIKQIEAYAGDSGVSLMRSWMPAAGAQAGLFETKYLKGEPPELFNAANNPCSEAWDGPSDETVRADIFRNDLRNRTPESFVQRMQQELPEKLSNMSLDELCSAKLDGKGLHQVAEEAYRAQEWHSGAEGSGRKGTLQSPTYASLRSLTTDPDKLAQRLRQQAEQRRQRERETDPCRGGGDQELCEADGQSKTSPQFPATNPFALTYKLFARSAVPPDTAAALFEATQRFEGVKVRRNATLAVSGESGVAVTRTPEVGPNERPERVELVFDPKTYELLGMQRVAMKGRQGVPAGTMLESTALLEQAVVSKKGQLP